LAKEAASGALEAVFEDLLDPQPLANGELPPWITNPPPTPEEVDPQSITTNIQNINNVYNVGHDTTNLEYKVNVNNYYLVPYPKGQEQSGTSSPSIPALPERKFKNPNTNQQPRNTPFAKIQHVSSTVNSQAMGLLLHRPISGKMTLTQAQKSTYQTRLSQERRDAAARFKGWADNDFEDYPPNFDFADTGALLLSGIDGDRATRLYFGSTWISMYSREAKRQAAGARAGLIRSVPTDYEVVEPIAYQDLKADRLTVECVNHNLLSKKMDTLGKALGIDDFPVTVPDSLLETGSGRELNLKTLPQILVYTIHQVDALLGQFPIKIRIEDADLTKPGAQPKDLQLPNMAETLAETFGMLYNVLLNTDLLINITTRTLTQAGQATVAAAVAQDFAKANAEFLGFADQDVAKEINFCFTPGETDFTKILKESKQKYGSVENVDKKNLQHSLTDLLQAASIIRAVFWRQIDPKKPGAGQIKDRLAELTGLANDHDAAKEDTDWDNITADIEAGFTNKQGVSTFDPYGRPYSERPKITQLGIDPT